MDPVFVGILGRLQDQYIFDMDLLTVISIQVRLTVKEIDRIITARLIIIKCSSFIGRELGRQRYRAVPFLGSPVLGKSPGERIPVIMGFINHSAVDGSLNVSAGRIKTMLDSQILQAPLVAPVQIGVSKLVQSSIAVILQQGYSVFRPSRMAEDRVHTDRDLAVIAAGRTDRSDAADFGHVLE